MQSTVACVRDHEVEQMQRPGYKCSNTVEQRMIPGGSNDERLTDVDSIGTTLFMLFSVSVSKVCFVRLRLTG